MQAVQLLTGQRGACNSTLQFCCGRRRVFQNFFCVPVCSSSPGRSVWSRSPVDEARVNPRESLAPDLQAQSALRRG